jgi:hypothetical protein
MTPLTAIARYDPTTCRFFDVDPAGYADAPTNRILATDAGVAILAS